MSPSCIQTFQDSLVHDSQSSAIRFVGANSLEQHYTTNSDYYQSSTSAKQKDLVHQHQQNQQPPRRFSYADLLSGQTTASYDNSSYYLPLTTSSPSNDSDDYQHPNSSASDSSSSSANDNITYMESTGSNADSSFMTSHPHSAAKISNDSMTSSSPASIQPYNLTCSPTPTVVEPQFLQQQHRHSIATAQHLGMHPATAATAPSSLYDSHIQRHHSFSHQAIYEQSRHHPLTPQQHQQQLPFGTSNNSGMIQGYHNAGLQITRPMTPASPHTKDIQQHYQHHHNSNSVDHMQQQQGVLNDANLSFPEPSMFSVSPLPTSTLQHQSPTPTTSLPFGSTGHLRENFLNHGKQPLQQLHEEKNNTKKTPRSRGRRVSNIPSNGARMFVCKVDGCGKVFKRSEHLKRHIRSIHTLEKPFECPYQSCSKRFSRSDNLNQHIRIHRHSTTGPTKLDKQQQKQPQPSSPSPLSSNNNIGYHQHQQQHQRHSSSENQPFANYVQNFI